MFCFLLLAVLLPCASCSPGSRRQVDAAVSVDDVILLLVEKLGHLLPGLILSQDAGDPCSYNLLGNDTATEWTMLDATGKINSNMKNAMESGLVQWLGDYDECRSVDSAHYCSLQILTVVIVYKNKTTLGPGFRWGLCLPKNCTSSALEAKFIREVTKLDIALYPDVIFYPADTTTTCDVPHLEYSTFAIVVIVICCFIGFLVLLATVLDYFYISARDSKSPFSPTVTGDSNNQPNSSSSSREDIHLLGTTKGPLSKPHTVAGVGANLLFSFSLVRNLPKLMETTRTAKSISCLHGIRTLSMMWVILGHCYFFFLVFRNVANLKEASKLPLQFTFQPIVNAFFSVDSFFFLSGLLVVYLSLIQMEMTSGQFGWIKFYLHRFWRLTPTYAIALLIYWQLMPYFADGPLWMALYDDKQCDHYWWTNLLYINNFHPDYSNMCMGWTWFLAADTQMYVLSPLVIIPAYFFGIYGLISLAIMLLAVLVTIAVIVSVNEYPANILSIGGSSANTYMNTVYIRFYTRAAPYLIGMAVGYFLVRGGPLRAKLSRPKVLAFVGWLLASAIGVTVVYGLYDYNHGHKYSQTASSLYLTFSSALWGVCLAWVVYACVSGRGGVADIILSWSGWFPLSRLTYSAYLLHPVVLLVYIGSLRQPVFIDNLHMAYFFVGVLGLSYASAAILSLCVEYPMAAMEKTILRTVRI